MHTSSVFKQTCPDAELCGEGQLLLYMGTLVLLKGDSSTDRRFTLNYTFLSQSSMKSLDLQVLCLL